jgi:hypothetical protein
MNQETAANDPQPKIETIEISNLDQFVRILAAWHEERVKVLKHMLEVPAGIEVSIDGGPDETLQGDLHRGFLMGLNVALMELGTLPFLAQVDESGPH